MAPAMAALASKLALDEQAPPLERASKSRIRLRIRPLAFVIAALSERTAVRLSAGGTLGVSKATQAILRDSDCCAHYQHVTRQTGKGNSDTLMVRFRTASRCIPSPPRRLACSDTAGQ